MSESGGQGQNLPWQYSQTYGYFIYLQNTDEILLQDGRKFARPKNVPRSADILVKATWIGSFQYLPSPEHYTHATSAGSTSQAAGSSGTGAGGASTLDVSIGNLRISNELSIPRGQSTTKTLTLNGATYLSTTNPYSQVRTVLRKYPPVAESGLFQRGRDAHRVLVGTVGDEEALFPEYKKRDKARQFFTIGRVFHVLWAEPAGEDTLISGVESGMSVGRYGEHVFSKVRRFVVIREGSNYCSALPIMTYGKQGVSKPGVRREEHAIIYTSKTAPAALRQELPRRGEAPMRPLPIRVDPDTPENKLDSLSRLDFGKVHTIQHNIKVKPLGKATSDSMSALQYQFDNVWRKEPEVGSSNPKTKMPNPVNTDTDPRMPGWIKALMGGGITEEKAREIIRTHQQKAIDDYIAKQAGTKNFTTGGGVSRGAGHHTGNGKGKVKAVEQLDDDEDDVDAAASDEGEEDEEDEDENEDEPDDETGDIEDDDAEDNEGAVDKDNYNGSEDDGDNEDE